MAFNCPICGNKDFKYSYYTEGYWGTVEQHGYCDKCGYMVEQAYSEELYGFYDIKRGFRRYDGTYVPKNRKKHKRVRRKHGVKNPDVNPLWVLYV